jgi:hypothetical protein
VDLRAASKRSQRLVDRHKVSPAQRHQLTDREAITGHDEVFAPVKPTHDLPTVIAELTLRDLA